MRELSDFSEFDGHIESILIGCRTAKVSFQTWNAKKLVLIYYEVEKIQEENSVFGDIGEYVIRKTDEKCFEYCFFDVENCLILRIVAQSAKIFEVGQGADIDQTLFDMGYECIGGQEQTK